MADAASSPTTQSPGDRRRAIPIKRWARWVAGMIGLCGITAGGVATFTRDVEAGPVALIAMGMLFMVMALAGVLPTRVKFGDTEAEWSQVAETVTELTSLVPPALKPEAVESLRDLATVAPAAAKSALAAADYEQSVLAMLRDVVAELNSTGQLQGPIRIDGVESLSADQPWDAVITGKDGMRLNVLLKMTSRPESLWLHVRNQMMHFAATDPEDRLLIITSGQVPRDFLAVLGDALGTIIRVSEPQDRSVLRAAVQSAFDGHQRAQGARTQSDHAVMGTMDRS